MKKLEIYGDSILKGVVCLDGAKKYKLYSGALAERMLDRGIALKKICKMGATINDGYARISKNVEVEDMSDTVLLIEFGGNDCAYDWREVSNDPAAPHAPKVEMVSFIEKYESAIECARAHGAKVILATLVPIDAEKYMNFISRGLSYDNIRSWLGDVSMLYRWHEQYSREVERISERHGCELIDLRRPFLLSHRFSSLIGDDGIHPTPEGHELIEDILISSIA